MGNLRWHYTSSARSDPVLYHPLVHIQQGHKQLGQIAAIYPGATHTRFDHAGFSAMIADEICQVLDSNGRPSARSDIVEFTKIHDISHPPFSHAVEYVLEEFTGRNHKTRLLEILDSDERDGLGRTLRDVLCDAGADISMIVKMIKKQEPNLASVCTDKTFGADKLGYTFMDAERTGFNQLPPDFDLLIPYLTMYDQGLGVDVSRRPNSEGSGIVVHDNPVGMVTAMQYFYFRMYTEVYLSPASLALERHIQKAVQFAIEGDLLDPNEIWAMRDDALIHEIDKSRGNSQLQRARDALSGFTSRDHFIPAQALKYRRTHHMDMWPGEGVTVIEPEFGREFNEVFRRPTKTTELEDVIEAELGIPVLVSVLPDPEKVEPTDVPLYFKGQCESLAESRSAHYANLREQAEAFFAIRLLVPSVEQEQMTRRDDLGELLLEKSGEVMKRSKAA